MDVMVFFGREGWRASSLDPTGANLPGSYGPWTPFRFVTATEPDEVDLLRAYGFYLVRRKETDDADEAG